MGSYVYVMESLYYMLEVLWSSCITWGCSLVVFVEDGCEAWFYVLVVFWPLWC